MGYEPKNIFFASDYFTKFYEHAITLIKKNLAFVCKLSKEEAKELREAKKPSPFRDTPIEENLREFELMRVGYYDEKEIVLRAKIDYTHPNPNN
jgi:glutaminyl-tRNA synthetase